MAVTISAALLFGVFLAFLLKARNLTGGPAFVAVMFGFFLASTGAAGPINHVVASLTHTLTAIGH
jgi:hypothetical protein